MLTKDRIFLLNEEGDISHQECWNESKKEKLWLYNLHYFDDLNAVDAASRADWHRALIQRWIEENPPGVGNGWEPYPMSLRIVNWIKWALQDNAMDPPWVGSIATQARFLNKRLEYHLLGNHLFANSKALIFAGLFFSGKEAESWLAKGLSILERELPEQILGDGGHFERSPMYHALILEDLLDLVNLCRVFGAFETRLSLLQEWTEVSHRMQEWLKGVCHPDGQIGFFNDAALGIAPTPSELESYAADLNLQPSLEPVRRLNHLPESGYIQLNQWPVVALLDVGEIGPDYLSGHAHADTLSFELSLFGQRVIVNSGTSCYRLGKERSWQRSTAAHNTVQIDGENSSEVWSRFRVARRARPFGLEILEEANEISVACAHDGYKRLYGSTIHRRQWGINDSHFVVSDSIEGEFSEIVAYFHLHPGVRSTNDEGATDGYIEINEEWVVRWSVTGGAVSVEESTYHPEFGLGVRNQTIKVMFTGREAEFSLQWELP